MLSARLVCLNLFSILILTRLDKFGSMTARKDYILQYNKMPYKTIKSHTKSVTQGHTSRMGTHMAMAVKSKVTQGQSRPHKANTAIHYDNVPQKIKTCYHCNRDFVNLILTYKNIFCSREHFLFTGKKFLGPLNVVGGQQSSVFY